jgi:hypothetical protein
MAKTMYTKMNKWKKQSEKKKGSLRGTKLQVLNGSGI